MVAKTNFISSQDYQTVYDNFQSGKVKTLDTFYPHLSLHTLIQKIQIAHPEFKDPALMTCTTQYEPGNYGSGLKFEILITEPGLKRLKEYAEITPKL